MLCFIWCFCTTNLIKMKNFIIYSALALVFLLAVSICTEPKIDIKNAMAVMVFACSLLFNIK